MKRAWLFFLALLLAGLALASPSLRVGPDASDSVRLNNLGVAYMNQQRLQQALALFQQASQTDPGLEAARLNQGIALLNLQRLEPALEVLLAITRAQTENLRAWYNLGLLYRNAGEPERALEAFDRVAAADSTDPDTQYFRGLLLAQLERFPEAVAAYQQALALNPFHVSAEFGLARVYHRLGKRERAREHLERFNYLKQKKLGAPVSLVYGEQGTYSLAVQLTPPAGPVPLPIDVRFVSVEKEAGLYSEEDHEFSGKQIGGLIVDYFILAGGACFLDYDGDARDDLFFTTYGKDFSPALLHNRDGKRFEDVTESMGVDFNGKARACAAGDYDNDGQTDLAVGGEEGVRLLRNAGQGRFEDTTEAAGIKQEGHAALTFVDYDHDGDLDLYVTGDSNALWRNNGNGTFIDWTDATGLAGEKGSVAAVATDWNNDRAIDLVVTGPSQGPLVFSNPREGRFQSSQPWNDKVPARTTGVAVFDFNKDGWMDLAFTHQAEPGLTLWRNEQGRSFARVPLPKTAWEQGWGLAAVDYDNDGWIDLAALGIEKKKKARQLRLFRNEGPKGFRDVTSAVGLDSLALGFPGAVVTADYDQDGDTDLLVTHSAAGVVLLRNDGGNRNGWLRVRLEGRADNRSAIGTKVEVFAGTTWQKWEVQAAGYLGQSATEIVAGLGQEKEAEIVRMLWPTGVLQDEIQLAARASHALREINRRGSSCPILFAWNGERFGFISDIIGAAIVGHWVGPGQRNVSDPDEYVRVEGGRIRPRRGLLEFRFMEPMEELIYLDQARLLAVDHPAGVAVYPNEYFASQPPFPPFKVIASRNARPPAGAWDDQGRDVLAELGHRDRRYVMDVNPLSFKGFARLHALELDLGPWKPAEPLRLLLHGLTDYFTATSVYAAHQAGVTAIVPYVEALTPEGRWVRVIDDMGFPAGLRRTMVADLTGRLPPGTRRIRLVTNLHIYWDQILIDTTAEEIPLRLTEAPLARAELRFHGYPRPLEGKPAGDLTYLYDQVSRTGPYARHRGSYTRYGDVLPLLASIDDRFAIFGPAEEVALGFDATPLPPLPAGWERDYFFFADGFVKDMDFYEAHALTVGPLPHHGMGRYPYPASRTYPAGPDYLRYQLEYNTRQVTGGGQPAFRFDFKPARRQE